MIFRILIIYFIFNSLLFSKEIEFNENTIKEKQKFEAGDTIILKAGKYKLNLILEDGVSIIGEEKEKIIVEAENKEKAIIKKYGSGIIENLIFQNSDSLWFAPPLYLSNSNAIVRNNKIINNENIGIYASFFNGIIENNIIENNKLDGIKIYNSKAEIKNNKIINNGDDGIQALHCSLVIDSNLITNNSGCGVEFWFDNNSKIINNNFRNNSYLINFVSGDSNIIFENNFNNGELLNNYFSIKEIKEETIKQIITDKDFFDTKIFNKALYYLMINEKDLGFEYRTKYDTILELPLFSYLFYNTLKTPQILKDFSDSIISNNNIDSIIFLLNLFEKIKIDLNEENSKKEYIKLPKYFPAELRENIKQIYYLTKEYNEEFNRIKSKFSEEEFEFLKEEILSIFKNYKRTINLNIREQWLNSENEYKDNLKLRDLLRKIDLSKLKIIGSKIIEYGEKISKIDKSKISPKKLNKEIIFKKETEFGLIKICGEKTNYHINEDCFILIDFGGDDYYKNSIAQSNEKKLVSLYFDFSGNDYYYSDTDFDIATSIFGISYLYDKSGNDIYKGENNSIATTYFGISIIRDDEGNDFYKSKINGISSAIFGYAIIFDQQGNDLYQLGAYGQALGSVKGYGLLYDKSGNDYYLSGGQIIDSLRYASNSLTMSQGCGFGIRPYIPGGLGIIVEGGGNDLYQADIFGQATAYWLSIGGIIDYSGDDKYISHRYSQSAAIHLAISCLLDFAGDDNYITYNVSQGCGHDIAFAFLLDKSGDDFYKNISLGVGAGITNAVGILIDENGNDGYYTINRDLGNGEYLQDREYGSIGVFIDKKGKDTYLRYKDKEIELKGKYGIFLDEE
ncbi:MAG TPA: right-handed parallel beta-helix repeat-containing protein [bacterium]|nr:right-handed parallel beta-helix repeat-containing protein [bacterium]HOL48585.1 right-handed parallel beta-helix repeat-containing protein [bacterium]HPQ17888.1 right-handed parallel beta-helix repeat-containing protein [bacterium]